MVRRGGGGGGHTKPPPPPRRGGPLFFSRADVDALAEPVPDGPTTGELLSLSKEHGMTIGAGLIERAADGSLFNSYVVAMPDGRVERHRKLHAFEGPHMKSGDSYTVFDTPHGWRVGVLICYDNNIVENARITALSGAEILLAPHQTGGGRPPRPPPPGGAHPPVGGGGGGGPAARPAAGP